MVFESRSAAGRRLAAELRAYADSDALVVGLTRGGMIVAHAVAQTLHLPLELLVAHKIAEPGHSHLHVGVVVEPDHLVVHRQRLRALDLAPEWLDTAVAHAVRDVRQRGQALRGARPRRELAGRTVILVDDSVSTGATMRAAVRAVRAAGARRIIVAVPVAPTSVVDTLQRVVDRVARLAAPGALIFDEVYYPQPDEVSDADIRHLLEQAESGGATHGAGRGGGLPAERRDPGPGASAPRA